MQIDDHVGAGAGPLTHVARISFSDHIAMIRGLRRRFGWLRYIVPPTIVLLAGTMLAGPALVVQILSEDPARLLGDVEVLATVALLFVILPITELLFDQTFHRWHYLKQRNSGRKISFAFTEDGMEWTVDGMAGRFGWSTVRRVISSSTRILIYIDDTAGIAVPIGGLSAADFSRLRRVVLSHLPATTKIVDRARPQ